MYYRIAFAINVFQYNWTPVLQDWKFTAIFLMLTEMKITAKIPHNQKSDHWEIYEWDMHDIVK